MFEQTVTPDGIQDTRGNEISPAAQQPAAQDPFIDHYFRRIDPNLAATFTAEQREAIKTMFGARGIARHTIELRRSIPIGRKRFYIVFLFGHERRTFSRLHSDGSISRPLNILGYAITAGIWTLPVIGAALLLNAIT